MKNATVNPANEEQKKENTKKIVITISLVLVAGLLTYLLLRSKQDKGIIILAEMLPLIEIL